MHSRLALFLLLPLLLAGSPTGGLYYFAGAVDGASSSLIRFDRASGVATELGSLSHADGYLPRAAMGPDGVMAAVVMPPGGRHNSPAELLRIEARDGRLAQSLVDDGAMFLQTPIFLGDGTLMWLRATPGPERSRPDGRLMQGLQDFDVMALGPHALEPRSVHRQRALWFELLGSGPSGFVSLSLADDGSTTVTERDVQGTLLRTALGSRPPVVDTSGKPIPIRHDGVERSVPVRSLADGSVVWWTYGSSDGQIWHLDGTPLPPADRRGPIELSLVGEGP
jgi:hypothetical protein